MRKGTRCALVCALLVVVSLAAAAQEAPKEPLFVVVYQDHVKPSKLKDYHAAVKDFVALMKAEKLDSPSFNIWSFRYTDELVYSYVTPMHSFGDMDAMHKDWMALEKGADKDKWEALGKRLNDDLSCSSRLIAMRVDAASYKPKAPRLKPDEARYRWYDFFYVVPGQEKAFVKYAKELADLAAKGGYADPWMVYAIVVGQKLPVFVVISTAKDAGDYQQAEKTFYKAIGEEGRAVMDKVMAITRNYEGHGGWYMPEFSYHPPSKEKPAKKE